MHRASPIVVSLALLTLAHPLVAQGYDPEARLRALGLTLPSPSAPVANYVNAVRTGNLLVNATPEFTEHPRVINGCSDLLVQVFGEPGRHARSAVGMASLPANIPVEIEMVVEVDERR